MKEKVEEKKDLEKMALTMTEKRRCSETGHWTDCASDMSWEIWSRHSAASLSLFLFLSWAHLAFPDVSTDLV